MNLKIRQVINSLSLLEGYKYVCDTGDTYPWYDKMTCSTIEGPTKKHTMLRLEVSFVKFSHNFTMYISS